MTSPLTSGLRGCLLPPCGLISSASAHLCRVVYSHISDRMGTFCSLHPHLYFWIKVLQLTGLGQPGGAWYPPARAEMLSELHLCWAGCREQRRWSFSPRGLEVSVHAILKSSRETGSLLHARVHAQHPAELTSWVLP